MILNAESEYRVCILVSLLNHDNFLTEYLKEINFITGALLERRARSNCPRCPSLIRLWWALWGSRPPGWIVYRDPEQKIYRDFAFWSVLLSVQCCNWVQKECFSHFEQIEFLCKLDLFSPWSRVAWSRSVHFYTVQAKPKDCVLFQTQ